MWSNILLFIEIYDIREAMSKFLKKITIIFLITGSLLWMGLYVSELILVKKLPGMMAAFSSPVMSISTSKVISGSCRWRACVVAKDVQLKILKQNAVLIGDVQLIYNPFHPLSVDVKTITDTPWTVDARLSRHVWQIRRVAGTVGSFHFDSSGFVDGENERGNLLIQTKGLRSFLNQFIKIPAWLSFLIRDTQQQITLSPKNGMLNLYGIPLIPI